MAFGEAAECFWLPDAIISHRHNKKLDPYLQVWKLKAFGEGANRKAVLQCLNDDKNVIIEQKIEYTNFPLDEITLWVSGSLLSPEGESIVSYDLSTKEYKINGRWSFMGDDGPHLDKGFLECLVRNMLKL